MSRALIIFKRRVLVPTYNMRVERHPRTRRRRIVVKNMKKSYSLESENDETTFRLQWEKKKTRDEIVKFSFYLYAILYTIKAHVRVHNICMCIKSNIIALYTCTQSGRCFINVLFSRWNIIRTHDDNNMLIAAACTRIYRCLFCTYYNTRGEHPNSIYTIYCVYT